jgi:TPP-dependent pyruvate/acetoin dehydrogenase alpha subunit
MPLERLERLLYSMQRIRMVEEAIAERYSENKMRCPTHLSIGQESVGAALGVALKKDDYVVSSHRAHAHYLGKGGDLSRMIAEIYGKETGCSSGKGGSMHLADPSVGFMGSTAIVGNSIPVGVGLAMAAQLKGTEQVSCCCIGDGSVEEGSFYESANFAAVKKIPVIFLCENNLYSVYSPLAVRQPEGREIYRLAEAIGLKSQRVDGNDAKETLAAIDRAILSVREGKGPYFIEFSTYRWREHCGPNYDNDIGYRTAEEFELWRSKEPIRRLQKELGLLDGVSFCNEVECIAQEIDRAFDFAESSPFPAVETRSKDIFSEELPS